MYLVSVVPFVWIYSKTIRHIIAKHVINKCRNCNWLFRKMVIVRIVISYSVSKRVKTSELISNVSIHFAGRCKNSFVNLSKRHPRTAFKVIRRIVRYSVRNRIWFFAFPKIESFAISNMCRIHVWAAWSGASEKRIRVRFLFSVSAPQTPNSITVKSTEWKMMLQTVLLSFVTNFRGNPIPRLPPTPPRPACDDTVEHNPLIQHIYRSIKIHIRLRLSFTPREFHSAFFSAPFRSGKTSAH